MQQPPNQPPYPPQQPVYPTYPTQPPQPMYPPPQPYSQTAQPSWPPAQQTPQSPMYPAPKPKNTKRGCLIGGVSAVVLVVALIVILASANSGGNSSSPGATSSTTSANSTQATAAPATHTIGDTQTLDGWIVTLTSVKTTAGGQFDTLQHAGDTFLEVNVSITNHTGQAQEFSSLLSLVLKDSTGQKYTETVISSSPTSPDGNIANGSKLAGTVVYEVPKSMKSFEFDFLPDPLGTDQATWTFPLK